MVSLNPHFAGRHVHLMGIAGAGMSALVPVLLRAGAQVSGCDLAEQPTLERFRKAGVRISLGHDPAHLHGVDCVVYSSAIPRSNRELQAAAEQGITVWSRQACLAELLRPQRTLAVAGSHGKTSTAWMIGHLLMAGGIDPLVLVGGEVAQLGHQGTYLGGGEWVVAEVDESDGGFAHTTPQLAVLTNLEAEHTDHYGSFAGLCAAFAGWLGAMGPQGTLVLPTEGVPEHALTGVAARQRLVGLDSGDIHGRDMVTDPEGSTFTVVIDGVARGRWRVPIPGVHMVHNALLAIAAVEALGAELVPEALASSGRVARRFTDHGRHGGIRVIEDYAHHPTEIRATLAAAALAPGQLHVVFQPHRYTRTRDCMVEFANAFASAANVVVVPTYAASEPPIAGADGAALAAAISADRSAAGVAAQHTQYAGSIAAAWAFVAASATVGDSILVLGAGDINREIDQLLERLR